MMAIEPLDAADAGLLITFRQPPYGSARAREGLEVALAAGAMGLSPQLLFLDDGVWQLMAAQDGNPLGVRTHDAMLRALPLYGVERLYADADSLAVRGIAPANLVPLVDRLDASAVRALLARSRTMFNF